MQVNAERTQEVSENNNQDMNSSYISLQPSARHIVGAQKNVYIYFHI